MAYATTLDRIAAEAKQLRPGRVLLTIVTAPFFLIGWLIGVVWLALALLWSAGVVGCRAGREVSPRRREASEGEPGRHIG